MNRYLIFQPEVCGNVKEEWGQCLEKIHGFTLTSYKLVKLNVFVNLKNFTEYIKLNEEIKSSLLGRYGNNCPAFSVIMEPPQHPVNVTVEARYMNAVNGDFVSKFSGSIPYVVRESGSAKEVWAEVWEPENIRLIPGKHLRQPSTR